MKFKIGDKVRIVKNIWDCGYYHSDIGIGEIHTIVGVDECDSFPYTLDKWSGYTWCDDELELVHDDKIVITHDGKTTTAKLYRDGETVTATAKCAPEDEFDFMVGAKLAVERLGEKVKPFKYPDGKYICVEYKTDENFFTLGKVYEQKNKRIVADNGFQYEPLSNDSAIEWLEPWYTFIPLVE